MPLNGVVLAGMASAAVLVLCVIAQFAMTGRVRRHLAGGHADFWETLRRELKSYGNVVPYIALHRMDRHRGDPHLTRRVLWLRRIYALGLIAWIATIWLIVAMLVVARGKGVG